MNKGMKSSEFWLLIVVVTIGAANERWLKMPWDQFQWLAGVALGYGGVRQLVKAGQP